MSLVPSVSGSAAKLTRRIPVSTRHPEHKLEPEVEEGSVAYAEEDVDELPEEEVLEFPEDEFADDEEPLAEEEEEEDFGLKRPDAKLKPSVCAATSLTRLSGKATFLLFLSLFCQYCT